MNINKKEYKLKQLFKKRKKLSCKNNKNFKKIHDEIKIKFKIDLEMKR